MQGMQSSVDREEEGEVGGDVDGRASSVAVAPLLLTIRDAARVLSVGRTTMYELIGAGAIEVVHIGRSARVPVRALEVFVERQLPGTVTGTSPTPSPEATAQRRAPKRRVPQRGDQGRLFGGPRQQA